VKHNYLLGAFLTLSSVSIAEASVTLAAFDAKTGLRWAKASELREGETQGYRAATTEEFTTYVTNVGFKNAGDQQFYGASARPLLGFASDVTLRSSMEHTYRDPIMSLGWLDGRTDQIGALLYDVGRKQAQCTPSDYIWMCFEPFYVHVAAFGSLSEMRAGKHDSYHYTNGGNWASALSQLAYPMNSPLRGTYNMSYFMVAEGPEPSTWGLVGIGLLALGVFKRRT
jgi:hypothetical protein